MKKAFLVIVCSLAFMSCDKKVESVELKTAYVDTSMLLDDYTEAKDIEAKYKEKSKVMGKELEAEVARFRSEAQNFQKNAQTYGQQWAQQKGAELQRKEQELSYAQEAMMRQLQEESSKEMDSMVKDVKKFIKDYGKEKGYNYIYGTGDSASILYAKEEYDLTKDIIKLLNDRYAKRGEGDAKKEETTEIAKDSTKK